jgi:modulator of FtsH protease
MCLAIPYTNDKLELTVTPIVSMMRYKQTIRKRGNTVMNSQVFSTTAVSSAAKNKLLRNTYGLLSLTLLFSAGTAGAAIALNLPHPGMIISLLGFFGLLFLVHKTQNSVWGIASVFALTGFMGLTLGPIVGHYLSMPGGNQIVMTALGGTGAIFLGLSGYVLTTKKDFSFMGGFLMVGILVAFLAGIGAWLFEMPGLSLAVSAMFVLLMSGLILYETSNIVNGGEVNYIMATVTLYLSIYNLFTALMHLLGAFSGDD